MHSSRKWSVGMLADVQANHSNSPVHAQCFSPLKKGKQIIVMSFSGVTMFAHASRRGVYKKSMHEPWHCCLGFWN